MTSAPPSSAHRPLHRNFSLQARDIAIDRGNGELTPATPVVQQTILGGDIAVYGDLVPFLGVTYIVDRHVVVLAPEERHGIEDFALSQHVARGRLALAFRNHPVFDTNGLPGMRIRPARDIT